MTYNAYFNKTIRLQPKAESFLMYQSRSYICGKLRLTNPSVYKMSKNVKESSR